MPPRYLRKGTTKLKACSEFTVEACDLAPADQCCGALPCTLCLELETYADGISYGTATFGGSSWTGTVGGLAFVSYWERNYLTDDCEYVVTLDGEEVYRATCYEGASCRDPGGSVGVTISYDEGTLTWAKHEPRPLALVVDPDTGCNDFFCGTCRCSCSTLCVTITRDYGGFTFWTGELADISYPCDAPVWEGTVGPYALSFALGRDAYGECIVTPTVDGVEGSAVSGAGCGSISIYLDLDADTSLVATCKQCCCNCGGSEPCSCDGRGIPNSGTANPISSTLTVDLTAVSSPGSDTCFNGTGTIPFKTALEGGTNCWEGDISGSCTDCNSVSRTWVMNVTVCCVNNTLNQYQITLRPDIPAVIDIDEQSVITTAITCNPLLLDDCIPGRIVGFVVGCAAAMTPATEYFPVCVQIYETA